MAQGEKRYTINDIARELGVSKTTVSRAISGKGRIGAATRERVLCFVESHGYRPDESARALAKSRTRNIGLLLPREYAMAEFPFFHDCMGGICEAAYESGYDVLVSMMNGPDVSQIRRLLTGHKVDGVILSRTSTERAVPELLGEYRMPFVVIGPPGDTSAPHVDNQNMEASKELTGLMLMKGMRRLALIGGSRRHLVTGSRQEGFRRAHEEHGVFLNEALIFVDVENQIQVMQAVNQALAADVEGIVCMDDIIAGLVMGCLREKGVPVPDDVRVASLYDSPQIEYTSPSVTSLRFDTRGLGRNACRILLGMLGETVSESELVQNYQVILRESTK